MHSHFTKTTSNRYAGLQSGVIMRPARFPRRPIKHFFRSKCGFDFKLKWQSSYFICSLFFFFFFFFFFFLHTFHLLMYRNVKKRRTFEHVHSEDSDQPTHLRGPIKIYLNAFGWQRMQSFVKRTQRRLWSDCADVQTNLSLRWAHTSESRLSHVAALLSHLVWFWQFFRFLKIPSQYHYRDILLECCLGFFQNGRWYNDTNSAPMNSNLLVRCVSPNCLPDSTFTF